MPADSRLRRLGEEKNELEDQLRRVTLELEEERHRSARARISGSGGGPESEQVQREVTRQVGEYRFKLQKADQDITNLQTAVSPLYAGQTGTSVRRSYPHICSLTECL